MKKIFLYLFAVLTLESCILFDIAKLPAFSNPKGSEVNAEIMQASNTITTISYFLFYSMAGGTNPVDALTEATLTDMILVRSLKLNEDKYYDRDSVDRCKDSMSLSSAFIPALLSPLSALEVSNGVNDNIMIAFTLTYLCDIEKGKVLYDDGENGF
ncbi:MAG: TIGR04452 family lipoprotein [Spirochaetia bacterium]|nr:TIGR04452 family lipoprotein [Spirochaetia bacterium]